MTRIQRARARPGVDAISEVDDDGAERVAVVPPPRPSGSPATAVSFTVLLGHWPVGGTAIALPRESRTV